ncbi:MAG: hypothetical protein R3C45_14660 [Phycisphaerales bacterium]
MFNLVITLMLKPRYFFRTMRIDGTNHTARLFLLLIASLVGLIWAYMVWARLLPSWSRRPSVMVALVGGELVFVSVIVLTYVEALGVTYFSRRRGWRVPFRLAERLVCYCAIGWVPVAIIMGITMRFYADGRLDGWMSSLLGVWGPWQSLELLVLIGAVSLLWFETLVWIGVRQTKYANG